MNPQELKARGIVRTAVWLICCLLTVVTPVHAQTAADSTVTQAAADNAIVHCKQEQFRWQRLVVPAGLVAAGAVGVSNEWFHRLRNDVRQTVGRWHDRPLHIDDYVQYLPVATNLGLRLTGLPARHSFREQAVSTATAYAVMGVLNNGMKYTIRERRPDSGTRNSFPSGHTATAFMGAELVRMEYGTWPGAAAYAVATGVAFMRIYNDRHWLNDVIGGAGIGILSTHIAYWLLPLERRLLGWNKKASSLTLLPTFDGRSAGVALTMGL